MSSLLNFREKTIVLVGPMTPIMQSLTMGLTQLGADIGLVNSDIDVSRRFAAQITDAREINSSFGKAFAIQTDFKDETSIKDAISRVAETFGGIDTYIDARTFFNLNWGAENPEATVSGAKILESKLAVTDGVLPFLKGRKKGRVIYLTDKLRLEHGGQDEHGLVAAHQDLQTRVEELAKDIAQYNVCMNIVTVGLTEEYLLYHYKGKSLQEALTELNKSHPDTQITEYEKITNVTSFLVSTMSAGLTGQELKI